MLDSIRALSIRVRDRFNGWYDRNARWMVTFCLAVAMVGAVLGFTNTVTNGRQDRERDAQRDALLSCFDQRDAFAAAQSTLLREKTQNRDDAIERKSASVKDFARATGDWSTLLVNALASEDDASPEAIAEFLTATAEIQRTSRVVERRANRLEAASQALEAARLANPVVPPASELCKTGVFVPPKVTAPTVPPKSSATPTPTASASVPAASPSVTTTPSADEPPPPAPSPKPSPKATKTVTIKPTPSPLPTPQPTTPPDGALGGLVEQVLDVLEPLLP